MPAITPYQDPEFGDRPSYLHDNAGVERPHKLQQDHQERPLVERQRDHVYSHPDVTGHAWEGEIGETAPPSHHLHEEEDAIMTDLYQNFPSDGGGDQEGDAEAGVPFPVGERMV